ncbi:MAG: FG-GAP-like repeat-containing protein [Polyangiaceae bacterium]
MRTKRLGMGLFAAPRARILGLSTLTVVTCGAGALNGCGSDDASSAGGGSFVDAGGGSGGSSGGGSGGTGGASSGGTFNLDGGDCACDGGVCIQGTCCEADKACGDVCCGDSDVCSFQQCVTPGKTCIDSDDCDGGDYCEYSLGEPAQTPDAGAGGATCTGGVSLATGRCLPRPPQCATDQEPGDPITCIENCEYHPPAAAFDPELKYHWDGGNVMMTPIVIQLDDDNCDGKVDAKDIPEILFSTFEYSTPATGDNGRPNYSQNGTLHAISIVGGQVVEKWSYHPDTPFDNRVHPGTHLAGGDIDGEPGNEVIVCTQDGRARALHADGSEFWVSSATGCFMPGIADIDHDGSPEVLVGNAVLDGKTGATIFPVSGASTGVFADVTGNGFLEVVTPTAVYDHTGVELANTGLTANHMALGDFDKDGNPEVVAVDSASHLVHVWHYDPAEVAGFKILRQNIDMNGTFVNNCPSGSAGATRGGGPPTVADFDGDGTADVAIATGIGYTVLGGTKLLDTNVANDQTNIWLKETKDCSSAATGSSVFDFDGDGKAEVVYADEHTLRIYDGTTGVEKWSTCNTSGTLTEYPLVADVDNDGHADLIVISNDYSSITCLSDGTTKMRGVRIFGDTAGKWVRTRRIWNQHTYHVTNVEEDGSIPMTELPNWKQPRLNNFRQNIQPSGEFSAPDLVVELRPKCEGTYGLIARVRNVGLASVPPGVVVGFYEGDPSAGGTKLGQALTTKALAPAEAEDVTLELPSASMALTEGQTLAFVVVDDGNPPHAWVECRPENNTDSTSGSCSGVR